MRYIAVIRVVYDAADAAYAERQSQRFLSTIKEYNSVRETNVIMQVNIANPDGR